MDGRTGTSLINQSLGARPVMDVPREGIPSHARAARPLSQDSLPCPKIENGPPPFRKTARTCEKCSLTAP